jgi:hypothetical protein
MDAIRGNSNIAARRLDFLAHAGGATNEEMVDALSAHQRAQQHPHLLAVKPAMQDGDVLFFAGNDMKYRKPLDEAILEFLDGLAKQHAAGRAIAVEQKEAAVRLQRQHALDDGKDRRDAGTRGKADVDAGFGRRGRNAEATGRRHHIEHVAATELIGRPVRERAAIDLLHGDAQFAVVGTGTNRIGAPHFLAVHRRSQRKILTGRKAVILLELLRDCKGQRYRVGSFAAQLADGKTMESRCVGHQRSGLSPSSSLRRAKQSSLSFRDGPKDQARNP